jgi:hypothetical protein
VVAGFQHLLGLAAGCVRRDARAVLACLLVTGAGAAVLLGTRPV